MPQGSSIGRSIRRLDGGEKVTGLTRFAGWRFTSLPVTAQAVVEALDGHSGRHAG